MALNGHFNLTDANKLKKDSILTILDFSKSSNEERMFVIDIKNQQIIHKTLVAHGVNTGGEFASKFSNKPHSNQSSMGFFVTGETYSGKQGFSMRLDGQEYTNSKVRQRGVVVHGANYVSEKFIKSAGRLGRSFGCPAVPKNLNTEIINTIKDKSSFFIYYPDKNYLTKSNILAQNTNSQHFAF